MTIGERKKRALEEFQKISKKYKVKAVAKVMKVKCKVHLVILGDEEKFENILNKENSIIK